MSNTKAQEIIDKVVAIVGENPILYSEIQGQKLQLLQQGMELDAEYGLLFNR
jgi:hypothetical protein